jgi:hypothetical protein
VQRDGRRVVEEMVVLLLACPVKKRTPSPDNAASLGPGNISWYPTVVVWNLDASSSVAPKFLVALHGYLTGSSRPPVAKVQNLTSWPPSAPTAYVAENSIRIFTFGSPGTWLPRFLGYVDQDSLPSPNNLAGSCRRSSTAKPRVNRISGCVCFPRVKV